MIKEATKQEKLDKQENLTHTRTYPSQSLYEEYSVFRDGVMDQTMSFLVKNEYYHKLTWVLQLAKKGEVLQNLIHGRYSQGSTLRVARPNIQAVGAAVAGVRPGNRTKNACGVLPYLRRQKKCGSVL